RGALLHHRGNSDVGDIDAAKAAFETAIFKLKGNPIDIDVLYSLWGFRYLDLLLDESQYDEVLRLVDRMEAAWKVGLPDRGPEQGLKPLGRMLEELAAARAKLGLEMGNTRGAIRAIYPSREIEDGFRVLSEQLWEMNRHDFRPYG